MRHALVSTSTGSCSRWLVARSFSTPIFASTSTAPPASCRRVDIVKWMKSAISRMNSSSGSTPRNDGDSIGSEDEAEAEGIVPWCPCPFDAS